MFLHTLLKVLCSAALLFSSLIAQGEILNFRHKDWSLTCDKTHSCRASSKPAKENNPLFVVVDRMAGPNTKVNVQIMFYGSPLDRRAFLEKLRKPLTLHLGDINLGALSKGEYGSVAQLSQMQVDRLIKTIKQNKKILFTEGESVTFISSDGLAAVLLKMDEYQKRVGTSSALVSKGNRSNDSVLAAVPLLYAWQSNEEFVRANVKNKKCIDFKIVFGEKLQLKFQKKLKYTCEAMTINGSAVIVYAALVPRAFHDNDENLAVYDLQIIVYEPKSKAIISQSEWKKWLETDYGLIIENIRIEPKIVDKGELDKIVSIRTDYSANTAGYADLETSARSLFEVDRRSHRMLLDSYAFWQYHALRHANPFAYEVWFRDFIWDSPWTTDGNIVITETYENGQQLEDETHEWKIERKIIPRNLIFDGEKFISVSTEPESPECKSC